MTMALEEADGHAECNKGKPEEEDLSLSLSDEPEVKGTKNLQQSKMKNWRSSQMRWNQLQTKRFQTQKPKSLLYPSICGWEPLEQLKGATEFQATETVDFWRYSMTP